MQTQIETESNQTSQTKATKKTTKSKTSKKSETSEDLAPIIEKVQEQVIQLSSNETENEDAVSIAESQSASLSENHDTHEYLQKLEQLELLMKFFVDNSIKNYEHSKEFTTQLSCLWKKITKSFFTVIQSNTEHLFKETISSIKKDTKNSKKIPKKIDKEKCAINIVSDSYSEVLSFMGLEPNTQISKAQLMQDINAYVKTEKQNGNSEIVVSGDNRSFKLGGKLIPLFVFIKKQMIDRGDIQEDSDFPTQLQYTQLMKYLKYCFPVSDKKK